MSAGKLPEGWVDTQLGNIVDYGKATKRVLSDVNDDTWVLELEDIEKESSKLLSTIRAGERPFKSTKNSFKKGDVLYGKLRPYLNKIIIAEEDGVCTTEIIPLSAEPSCCNKYIFYWLKSSTFLGYVNDVSYGVNMPRLGTADGLKAPLRLAPLAEQKIIAEKLDTLLAQVDSTKARLEQIPQILKRFRQAVLTTAVYGSLTKEWRENKKIHAPTPTTLEALINSIDQGWSPKCENYPADKHEWGVIKTTAVQPGYFISDGNKKLPSSLAPKFNLSLKKDDILITRAGPRSRCGITCIVNQDYPYLMICDKVYRVRVNHQKILSGFLNWCLNSPKYLEIIERIKTGSSDSGMNLTQKKFLSFTINVPDILEQHEIVRRVEQLFAYADTIEKQVNNALTRINSLTQSILAKAFRGELTAQWRAENPDLISGENSAAALLEKIKAERAASGGKKTSRKKA